MAGSEREPLKLTPPRGTHDLLPPEADRWRALESVARDIFDRAGYREIRVPVFEHTELFRRGVGDTTDIVNKEMYTFTDRSDRSLTLRPEGTAGVVRAYLNGGLHRSSPPVKLWYAGAMFRYERAQTGRQRQFHQIGAEAFGSAGPLIDAEIIAIAAECLQRMGAGSFDLQINSIGCQQCRPAYRKLLKETLAAHLAELCPDCQDRFERNPLRMLDCKSERCQFFYRNAPASLDYLCGDCQDHWQGLGSYLKKLALPVTINPRLVRGLDYYTRSVVEFVCPDERLGTQTTICAGGRYDNLVEEFGGPPTPAVGWAMGMERLCLLIGAREEAGLDAFVVASDPEPALTLVRAVREAGYRCDMDYPQKGLTPRKIPKQLGEANRQKARLALILGGDEIAAGEVTVKDMGDGTQSRVPLGNLIKFISERLG